MPSSAVAVELTMWVAIRESAAGSAAFPMVQPSDNALPRSAAVAAGSASDTLALDAAMDRYARGEDAAFAELHRRGTPRLRGFLVRLCGDVALAEDLTQEAFLRVHLARGSFAPNAPALPWMLAIARNAFLDHTRRESVRRVAREQASETSGGRGPHAGPEARGDELFSARETLEIVRRALDEIPLLQREAFVLLRFEGLSVRDAAQVLGATEAAVKVRAFRAYEALRKALQREDASISPEP